MVHDQAVRLAVNLDGYKKISDLDWSDVSKDSYNWILESLTEMREFFVAKSNNQAAGMYDGNCTHGCNLLPKPTEVPA